MRNNPSEAKDKIWNFIFVQSIIVTALSLPVFLVIRNNPETPPSRSAEKKLTGHYNSTLLIEAEMLGDRIDQVKRVFSDDMRTLLASGNFWLLNIVFSFIYAVYNTLGAAVGVITKEFGYTSTDNSVFGVVFIVSGISGSFIHAILLDRYNKYKLHLIIVGAMSVLAVGLGSSVIDISNLYYTSIALFMLGAGLIPIIGVGNSFGAEIIFPIGEAIGGGFMLCGGSLLSIPFTLLTNYLVSNWSKWWAFIMFGIGSVIPLITSFFIQETLKKKKPSSRKGNPSKPAK